jgi:hypothetical protein
MVHQRWSCFTSVLIIELELLLSAGMMLAECLKKKIPII